MPHLRLDGTTSAPLAPQFARAYGSRILPGLYIRALEPSSAFCRSKGTQAVPTNVNTNLLVFVTRGSWITWITVARAFSACQSFASRLGLLDRAITFQEDKMWCTKPESSKLPRVYSGRVYDLPSVIGHRFGDSMIAASRVEFHPEA